MNDNKELPIVKLDILGHNLVITVSRQEDNNHTASVLHHPDTPKSMIPRMNKYLRDEGFTEQVEMILEKEEHLENEYLSTGGECGVAHAEAVGSAIQAGFDSYDAKLYVRQQRPKEER